MVNASPSQTNITFFNAQTTSANSTSYSFIFPNKSACLKFWGTWDGATITFETITPLDNTYWIPISFITGQSSFAADGQATLENVVYGDLIRCVLSNAGAGTSISVTAQAI